MPPKFWASSEDMSVDESESADSSIDLHVDRINKASRDIPDANRGPETARGPSGRSEDNALARTMATSMSLPNLQPQQHANLFYLSLIEDRCRTQAAKSLNAQRRKEDWLEDDHPGVCELAQHLFSEMKRDLLKAGIIPPELASKSPDLQLYLRSFDALLHNIAATRGNQDISAGYRGNLPLALDQSRALIPHNINNQGNMIPLDPSILSLVNLNSAKTYPQSVYCQQYEEIALLGSGGEGAVYKAKYIVDRAEYAIKKVVIPAKKLRQLQKTSVSLSEKLKEVYALAKLNHPNVVRYHHSWIEFQKSGDSIVPKQDGDSSDGSEADSEVSVSADKPITSSEIQASYSEADTSLAQEVENLHIGFTQHDLTSSLDLIHTLDESYDNDLVVFGNSSNAAPESEEEIESQSKAIQRYSHPGKVNIDAVLYIKMTAYPSTLDTFLRSDDTTQLIPGHCFHILPTIRVLIAIIDGLQYIHRRNIIHQDLKPGNVFLSVLEAGEPATSAYVNIADCPDCATAKTVKSLYICPHIGDFGMIKEIKAGQPVEQASEIDGAESANELDTLQNHTLNSNISAYKAGDSFLAGTGFYKPPWIRGIKPIICPKRDCYALGAIAVEMIYRFGSKSERVHVFNQLRDHGVFPKEVRDHKLGECIMGMLQADRDQRWSLERVKEFLLDMEGRLC